MTHSEKLERIEMLMSSPDVIELDALTSEVAAFEREHFPIAPPTLGEAMKFRREQMRENQKEISTKAGMPLSSWKALESGKNQPSMKDARCLYAVGIPAAVIFGENAESIRAEIKP
jgi:HTH-type transcriptional regulator / antitoxin HigA